MDIMFATAPTPLAAVRCGSRRTSRRRTLQVVGWIACFAAWLSAPATVDAQQWLGPGKLSGVVLDKDEKPLAGATVQATLAGAPDVKPPAASSTRRGRFVIPRLVPGEWQVRVSAEGYVTSEGRALVTLNGSDPLRIVLRPLAEVPPASAETPVSIAGWLARGNSLLQQGRPAAARAEYERALRVVPPPAQPEILRAVARSHMDEKNYDDATRVLQRALVFGPDDAQSRRFFTLLMEARGLADDGARWLERLDTDGTDAMRREMDLPPALPPGGRIPLRLQDGIAPSAPQAGRTGRYRVAFENSHPLATLQTIETRYGYSHDDVMATDAQANDYSLEREAFEVYVPAADAEAAAKPMGLLVWVSPTPMGRPPPQLLDVLTEHRIIWVGANDSGNPRPPWDRVRLALDAAHNMQNLYAIDPQRIYAAGYSGGGRVATGLSVLFPEVFHGGLFVYGVDFYRQIDAPDRPGMVWPAPFPPPPKETLKQVRQRNRYVFLTGELDFNRLQTRTYERLYREEGFRHTRYIEIPGAHHYSGVPPEWFDKALTFLEN